MSEKLNTNEVIEALNLYRKGLGEVEELAREQKKSKSHVMELLFARDAILKLQNNLELRDIPIFFEKEDELILLDEKLRNIGGFIASTLDMAKWRSKFKPSEEEAWWWFFVPPMDPWRRFDWVFNAFTAGVLALSASYMINIYKAVSVGNASIAVTFSTIAQAAGLAIVGGGALSEGGKQKVQQILGSLNIPKRFFAEVTFILSLVLLASVYYVNNTMDDNYYHTGHEHYENGELSLASLAYQQGLAANPLDKRFSGELGEVYESLGSLDLAAESYQKSVEAGDIKRLNDLGRVTISLAHPVTNQANPVQAEAVLMLGLQRAQTMKEQDPQLMYELNRNIGWSLLDQGELGNAEYYLLNAVAWDEKIKDTQPGGGMAYCFLARIYDKKREKDKANEMWLKCMERARPEFISEYKWFLDVDKDGVAFCVDSSDVVSGFEGKRGNDFDLFCDKLKGRFQGAGEE